MSGIVGIVNLNCSPIDRPLLRQMTEFMCFRGPDAQEIWCEGHVGFGHALFKSTDESEHERQPFSLDGQTWIVADARIDAQKDLIGKLQVRGHGVASGAPDVELVLRAYQTWREKCVEHLLGDFSFAIWDGRRGRLFCARDHLGVKPFFYASLGHTIIFSNTLDTIRQHPLVSSKLNDLAIADFLLFGVNKELDTTSFSDIRRLAPAHCASWSTGGVTMRRFWVLPIDEPVYFKHVNDYTDRFKELLRDAVSDRLRTNRVGVLMSGGLDSTSLAAIAKDLMQQRHGNHVPIAFTTVLDGIIDNQERFFADLVAERLSIPIHYRELKVRAVEPEFDRRWVHSPEPVANALTLSSDTRFFRFLSSRCTVCFYGEGPDNALRYEWRSHLSCLIAQRRFSRLLADLASHVILHRRIPLLPTMLRQIRKTTGRVDWTPYYPNWFDKKLEANLQLRARWQEGMGDTAAAAMHPVRPKAYDNFTGELWAPLFESLDAANTTVPVAFTHPFVDLRLLRYLLSVPALPWCRDKYLFRRAMRGVLPRPVLCRPKSPLASDPDWEYARYNGLPPLIPSDGLTNYVNPKLVPKDADDRVVVFRVNLRVRSLNLWMHSFERNVPTHDKNMEDTNNERLTEVRT